MELWDPHLILLMISFSLVKEKLVSEINSFLKSLYALTSPW